VTRVLLATLACVCTVACATTSPPVVNLDTPVLFLNSQLPDEAQLCVAWPRFTALVPPYGCIGVGELRVILRGRVVARLDAQWQVHE
jgi:hypothetical protein